MKAAALTASSLQAEARNRNKNVALGIAAGLIIGAAIVVANRRNGIGGGGGGGRRQVRMIERYDGWGNVRAREVQFRKRAR